MSRYIDLHVHLDGAVTPAIARRLAALQGIPLPQEDAELKRLLTVPPDCTSLNDFLRCFALPVSLLQTYEALREAACLVAEELRAQGDIYAELRYAPQLHTAQGMTQEQAVLAVLEGLAASPLKCNLILCCMRGADLEAANRETLAVAAKQLVPDGGVVAVDLAGAEALFPTADYRGLFAEARALGLPFTIHAGEAAGADSVRLAAEYGAARIGHGVRSQEDPALVALLKEKGICLEMCPTSNRQTCAVTNMASYPLLRYLEEGLRVTVNTDDPAIEGTDIAAEYRYLEDRFSLTETQKRRLLINAAEAAFTTESVKAQLRRQLGL